MSDIAAVTAAITLLMDRVIGLESQMVQLRVELIRLQRVIDAIATDRTQLIDEIHNLEEEAARAAW